MGLKCCCELWVEDPEQGSQKAASCPAGKEPVMILEIVKTLSFFLSLLCLYPVVLGAFFEPGSRWEDRLVLTLARIGLAGCVCFLSGLLFAEPWRAGAKPGAHVLTTLPVRLYLWTIFGVGVLFVLSWYLEEFYVPYLSRNLP
jgi:hypothetical protein